MNYTPLSVIPKVHSVEELINYLIDKGSQGIVNDLTPEPNVEYDLADLQIVGHRFISCDLK